ncbi:LysR family transcriptional regulator [Mesorhizobium sp. XAP10]|uniref:LysR family transcriptional regulator n=1 Tax=unclassified Mesorhizobium TaxID=325217 RepID=UPI0023DEACF7|nr:MULTISPECIES: LysR family transcriptional regulator [unclassified Mesorhizobium]MDF3154538.1 LysR family transcriptional regulator [Mesorhizobium sp. XAP10]MDF3247912.1 LysR family transcriptional regulator [Mesorhizobium sp. XAP4]
MDRFHELSAFIAVVEAGGFSAAARRTGDTQSSISKAVGALERRLGVLLFNRSTRSVTLTDDGQSYYQRTRPLVEEIGSADFEMSSKTPNVAGQVRIAAAATFGRLHVLPLIPALLAMYPELKIDLVLSDSVRDMVDDRIDLTIRVGSVSELDSVVRHVSRSSLVCAGSRQYFDRHGIPATPDDLAHHNCLIYKGTNNVAKWRFVGAQGKFSVPVSGNLSSNSMEAIRASVLAGVGIGLFTRLSLSKELGHPDIITVLDEFLQETVDVSLIWPSRRLVSSRVRRVTDYFVTALREAHDLHAPPFSELSRPLEDMS